MNRFNSAFIILILLMLTHILSAGSKPEILINLKLNENEYKALQQLQINFVTGLENGTSWAVVTKAELALLKERGFSAKKIMESTNPIDLYKRALHGESMKLDPVYYTYEKILSELDKLIAEHNTIIRKEIIGRTSQMKKDIWAVKISDNVQQREDEPKILFEAAIHANELAGVQICMRLIHHLVTKYDDDPRVTGWVDAAEIWIIPVINVDGHHAVTYNIDPTWRKNARDSNNNGVLFEKEDGIDLNRNFDFNWAFGGSGDPASKRYRGASPFSETECQAVGNFAAQEKFLASITYHSYGEVIFYPWDWRGHKAPDDKLLTQLAHGLASQIKTIKGDTTYIPHYGSGTVGQTYPWFYGRVGILDFIVELGNHRHIFSPEILENIVQSNLPGAFFCLDLIDGPGLTGHVQDAKTGEALDATVFFPDIDNESVDPRTANSTFGRFYRLLLPGKYRVIFSKQGYASEVHTDVEIPKEGWKTLDAKLNPLN